MNYCSKASCTAVRRALLLPSRADDICLGGSTISTVAKNLHHIDVDCDQLITQSLFKFAGTTTLCFNNLQLCIRAYSRAGIGHLQTTVTPRQREPSGHFCVKGQNTPSTCSQLPSRKQQYRKPWQPTTPQTSRASASWARST